MNRRKFIQSLGAGAAAGMLPFKAFAQTRQETLLALMEFGPNSLDVHTVGANRPAYGVSWNCYDRLLTYGKKKLSNGTPSYDFSKLEPELAESWEFAKDGMSVTFKLKRDAKFHDGTPVTARDVKWSFDRAVTVGGFPTFQMKAGSLEKPEQFVAVDDHTFRINFLRKDKMAMPDIAVPVPSIFNSALVKKHATPDDPWGLNWTKSNVAGGGAFRVESWKPGQETVFARYDDWKSGPLPKMRRIILREVPSAGNRRALLERGDADISFDLPPKDFNEFAKTDKINESSVPIENSMWYVGMNVTKPPFNNPKVRQAVAYAVPYDKIMSAAFYNRATKLYGAKAPRPANAEWPQAHAYTTDLAKARQLMQEAGVGTIETTLSYDLGQATVSEPIAILLQESLAAIGIKVTINKIPGANWRAAMLKKDMPLMINRFGGWLNYADYFFFWNYHGQNAVFNTPSYVNPAMDKLIDAARFESDPKKYESLVKGFIELANADVPRIPIAQPWLDVAMQRNITGYHYWFHLQPDFRQMAKT
jgi:peptide/nickel transport system substrate-binding protein